MASSRMIALLGLLAVAGYQNRDKLGDMFRRVTGQDGENTPASTDNAPGGLLGSLSGSAGPSGASALSPNNGGFGGFLNNLFGGGTSARDGLSGGLRDLVDRFKGSGHAREAQTWVETGPNADIEEDSLQEALGEDTIQTLTQQTGLDRQELLSRLRAVLPSAVDKLTPDGRLPSPAEAGRAA